MLTFKLIDITNGFYHYEIYPENKKEDKGSIIFNPVTQEVKQRIDPKGPFNYWMHFGQGLKDASGNYKESGMVAWY